MRPRVTPRNQERMVEEDGFLASKTDLKGIIKYANRAFITISGYSEQELLGVNHNLVRHPDMPRAVFYLLWQELKQRREVFAYVKNLCKDGAFYWVMANVTPSIDATGKVLGYYSVRRRPRRSAIAAVTPLYKSLLAEEGRHAQRKDGIRHSIELLHGLLEKEGVDYDEFVLAI